MTPEPENIPVAEIKRELAENPKKGIEWIIALAQGKQLREQYFKAIILKSEYNNAATQEKKTAKLEEARALAYELANETPAEKPKEDEAFLQYAATRIFNAGLQRDTVLSCTDLCKQYKKSGFQLAKVSFSLQAGDIMGLVGENGDGKSTLLKMLAGELAADSGDVAYPFFSHSNKLDWRLIKSKIAYLPQTLKGLNGKVINSLKLYAALHGKRGKENDFEVDYIVSRLGLDSMRNAAWSELSGGYRLRFALARILLGKPKVMLLDEPLANLDINAQSLLLQDLASLSKNIANPVSIIISSQHLEEVESIADKMLVLIEGQIAYNGQTENIGKNRTENTFEFRTRLDRTKLAQKLEAFDYVNLGFTGTSYVISTPLSVSMENFMQHCVQHGIAISFLNDMSNSTKKILLHLKTAA